MFNLIIFLKMKCRPLPRVLTYVALFEGPIAAHSRFVFRITNILENNMHPNKYLISTHTKK